MTTDEESLHPPLVEIPEAELIEDPPEHDQRLSISMDDLSERVGHLESLLNIHRPQYGSGSLNVATLPTEDTSSATPKLIWTTSERLTCQTPLGRNLQLRGFELHLWRDARVTFTGPMYNVSRHSDWRISFRVEVWFKSGHHTRPEAESHLGSLWLRHGRSTRHTYRAYSDSLGRLYDVYRNGEYYLKFRISGSRTN